MIPFYINTTVITVFMLVNLSYKSFKFRLYPSPEQEVFLEKSAGSCRFVYNKLLESSISQYQQTGKFIFGFGLSNTLLSLKKEYPWLKEVNSQSLQQASMNLSSAFKSRFSKNRKGNSGFPRFKSRKNSGTSFSVPQHFLIQSGRIKLPKIGWISCRMHRKLEGKAKSLTILKDVDQWYVSILCEMPNKVRNYNPENAVGIDLGLKSFAVTSDGEIITVPTALKKHQKRLKQLQRRHAKKQKGSKNREKARIKVARHHRKIRRINKNFIEITSNAIAKQYDVVSIESLNIKGMKKNRRLSGAIHQVSWYAFGQALERKVAQVHKVDRFYPSSKICSCCGWINKDMTLSERTFECDTCDNLMDRDANAATNLLNHYKRTVATAGLACGEDIRPEGDLNTEWQTSMKQEYLAHWNQAINGLP